MRKSERERTIYTEKMSFYTEKKENKTLQFNSLAALKANDRNALACFIYIFFHFYCANRSRIEKNENECMGKNSQMCVCILWSDSPSLQLYLRYQAPIDRYCGIATIKINKNNSNSERRKKYKEKLIHMWIVCVVRCVCVLQRTQKWMKRALTNHICQLIYHME